MQQNQALTDKIKYQQMLATHKRVYYRKPKQLQKARFNPDPISTGIRASILAKFDDIYEHIEILHAQNSFVKTFASSKSSFSAPKSSANTERKSQDMSRMGKTVYAPTERIANRKFCITKRSTDSGGYENKSWIDKEEIKRMPYSQINIRQLLQKRCKMQQIETNNLIKNPYYKIMKRRVKTQFKVEKQVDQQISKGEQIKPQKIIKTQCLTESITSGQDNLLKSNYSISDKRAVADYEQDHGIRKKSETKVYQQIKKYFQEKYGRYKTIQKK